MAFNTNNLFGNTGNTGNTGANLFGNTGNTVFSPVAAPAPSNSMFPQANNSLFNKASPAPAFNTQGAFGPAPGTSGLFNTGVAQPAQNSTLNLQHNQPSALEKKLHSLQSHLLEQGPTYAFRHVFHTPIAQDLLRPERENEIRQNNSNPYVRHLLLKKMEDNKREQKRMLDDSGDRHPDPRGTGRFADGVYSRDAARAYKERVERGEVELSAQKVRTNFGLSNDVPEDPIAANQRTQRLIEDLTKLDEPLLCIEEVVTGFDGLKRRRDYQAQMRQLQEQIMQRVSDEVAREFCNRRELQRKAKELQKVYTEVTRPRMIKILQAVECAKWELGQGAHVALTADEERFREVLNEMLKFLMYYDAQLSGLDLSSCVQQQNRARPSEQLDEDSQRRVVDFLKRQKTALEIITAEVHTKKAHMEVMDRVYNQPGGVRGGAAGAVGFGVSYM